MQADAGWSRPAECAGDAEVHVGGELVAGWVKYSCASRAELQFASVGAYVAKVVVSIHGLGIFVVQVDQCLEEAERNASAHTVRKPSLAVA